MASYEIATALASFLCCLLFFYMSRLYENYYEDRKKPVLYSFLRKYGFYNPKSYFGRHMDVHLTSFYLVVSLVFFNISVSVFLDYIFDIGV